MSLAPAVAVLLLSLALAGDARRIQYKDCGSGEIQWVDVDPCDKEPCMFKKNTIVHVSAEVLAKKDVSSATLKATVLLGDVEVEYPGIEPDVCKIVKCPIKSGDRFTVNMDVEVADYFPAVSSSFPRKHECRLTVAHLPTRGHRWRRR